MYWEKYFSHLSVEKPDTVPSTFVEYMHPSNIHLGRHTFSANSATHCMLSVGFSITFILALLNQQEKQVLNKKNKREHGKKVILTWRMINMLQKWIHRCMMWEKDFFYIRIEYSLRTEINNFAVQLDFWDRVIWILEKKKCTV